ncbi:MAG: NUDIX hydrolase [Verrucomicrobia bacterium]|nr:NUDIX hydrolase [Verrucomicrobiota bacterium]
MKINPVNTSFVFLTSPENFQPRMEIVACFMTQGENVLFLKRQPHKSEGSKWGIPGGKVHQGETLNQAILREVREETAIDLEGKTLMYFGKVYIRYPEIDFLYHMYGYDFEDMKIPVTINLEEHSQYQWITLTEALKLPLIRGEDECIYLVYGKDLSSRRQIASIQS